MEMPPKATAEDRLAQDAKTIFDSFDDSEKGWVRMGVFPHLKMPEDFSDKPYTSHDMVCALMAEAKTWRFIHQKKV